MNQWSTEEVERFENKIEKIPFDSCWHWVGGRVGSGYGGHTAKGKRWRAHRIAYEVYVGPIPTDLEIDHLCRVKLCVNPIHLETVTRAENMRRIPRWLLKKPRITCRKLSSHCKHGHSKEGNTYKSPSGKTRCRICNKFAAQRYSKRA